MSGMIGVVRGLCRVNRHAADRVLHGARYRRSPFKLRIGLAANCVGAMMFHSCYPQGGAIRRQ
jgi:hypothetical protein